MDAIKWFPLDRLQELESRIAELAAAGPIVRRRDALACVMGLHGLRVTEVINANNGHLFIPTKTLSVPTLKKGAPRKVKLDETVIDAIRAWQQDARFYCDASDSPILPSTRRGRCRRDQFEALARVITTGLLGEPLTFHCFRHTFAMRLYAATKDLFLVQRQLGHRSVKNTEVYARSLEQVPEECLVKMRRKDDPPPSAE